MTDATAIVLFSDGQFDPPTTNHIAVFPVIDPGLLHPADARVVDPSAATGTYVDEDGRPLAASRQVSDPAFSDRYIAESRALLATVEE